VAGDRGHRLPPAVKPRRFPPPWRVEDNNHACFIVLDKNGQALAYFYLSMNPRTDRRPIC
jgi:hypothetical protein